MDQLRDWYIKYREREGKFPDFPPEEEEEPTAEELAAAAAGDGKDAKKDPKKDAKKVRVRHQRAPSRPPASSCVSCLPTPPQAAITRILTHRTAPPPGPQEGCQKRQGC